MVSSLFQNLHFPSILGKYYNFNNIVTDSKAVCFPSFTQAYEGKRRNQGRSISSLFHLSRKSCKPCEGAVYFKVCKVDECGKFLEHDDFIDLNLKESKEYKSNNTDDGTVIEPVSKEIVS